MNEIASWMTDFPDAIEFFPWSKHQNIYLYDEWWNGRVQWRFQNITNKVKEKETDEQWFDRPIDNSMNAE